MSAAGRRRTRVRPLELDGERLTRRAVVDVARRGRPVRLASAALRRVARCARFLECELKRGEPIYGVTTGFGSNADRLLGADRIRPGAEDQPSLVTELQRNLVLSHAVNVGAPLPREVVRAMLVIRINTLLRGHSGVRTATLRLLTELVNRDLVPVIPAYGSVGASGDLSPLSHMALPLLGAGSVWRDGEVVPAAQALAEAGLEPVELGIKEGLALNNGTALMLALAVLVLDETEALLKTADLIAAVSLEAFCGRSAAFDARVHELRPHPGQMATAENLRQLLAGSGLIDVPYHLVPRVHPWTPRSWAQETSQLPHFDIRWDYVPPDERSGRDEYYRRQLPFRGGKKAQPQDAYSLRCIPQVHGAVKDAWLHLKRVVDIELNAVTDNPIVFPTARAPDDLPDDDEAPRVISAGNFHGMPLALAMAGLKVALPVLASISERRANKLLDPATNDGLPPFLAANEDGTDSGLMIVQYTAAALVNKLATRSHAAATHSIPTSANTEDHVSMGANEALDLWEMCGDLGRVLAIELWVATQALEQRQLILSCAYAAANQLGVQALRSKVRNVSPVRPEDAMRLAEDIKRLQQELRRLKDIGPARPAARVLALVRGAGVAYLDRDRALHPELEILQRLVRERVLIRAIEDELGLTLELG